MNSWKKALLAIAVVAVVAGCSGTSSNDASRKPSGAASSSVHAVANASILEKLPARLAEDGVAIEVGSVSAPHTVTIYEDFRCPYCSKFEQANGALLRERVYVGHIKIHYVFASFLDEKFGGTGSVRAASAVRAALDSGAFASLHALFAANQPQRGYDGFTVERILQLADTIPALESNSDFATAVRSNTHSGWVTASQAAYTNGQQQHPTGVPTVVVNDVNANDALYDSTEFATFLDKVIYS
ncbi:MAG: thioredoxin domain-containing protein [Longispora sp.]|nr:thioredoxin domain-containing protein [Longispora sp. (in: high G+C Gram-positive bacteria)]